MIELWLKFTDENGDGRRVAVNDELFIIGRHSSNDLCISDNRLSREHARIERFSDQFYVSDSNSSNGSTLNGAPLGEARIIRDGDVLNLGGINMKIEIVSDEANAANNANANSSNQANDLPTVNAAQNPPMSASVISQSKTISADSNQIPTAFFWLAPAFGLVVLIVIGGLLFVFAKKEPQTAKTDDYPVYTPRENSSKKNDPSVDDTPTPRTSNTPDNSGNSASSTPDTIDAPTPPKASGDAEKIEQNAASFLRRIAQNDPRAFLTGKQTEAINSKINQFKGSAALAENLKAVKKNAAQFSTLADSKNLKGQFLAAAALTKIGNSRGEPLAVANQMLPILSDLKVTLDNKLADDNLLIIAAYDRGEANQPRSLQTTLEALSKQTQNISPREIRTIWFLHEKGKITDAEYNFALQFIAIGAIMQNPKDFNVNADAVIFN